MKRRLLCGLAILVLLGGARMAGSDMRLQVEVLPDEENGSAQALRTDVKKAVDLALPALWDRLVPVHARHDMPEDGQGLGLLLRASPTADGMNITFNRSRVWQYLKKRNVPFIDAPPAFNVIVHMYNLAGIAMPQSAALLAGYAREEAARWGYQVREDAPALVLNWRWLDQQQVSLSVRGNSRLPEFAETRMLEAGDPLPQMQAWLLEVMLRARDAYASDAMTAGSAAVATAGGAAAGALPGVPVPMSGLERMLTIHRHATLPEQVLFEDALRRHPRVAALVPYLLSNDVQQYRLVLKSADDHWLMEWFARNGMQLSPRPDGWLAQ
ncbi:MAG: hypothetical protein Q9M29_04115 [Mariprofundaceae bacterium]|nr:hypothetical protein [Mariprofundaceae bacterium]